MQSTASASFFVDPWSLYAAGRMQVHTQNDSYVVEVHDATPHLHFKGFEMGEHVPARTLADAFRFAKSYARDSGELWAQRMIQDNERRYTYRPLGEKPFHTLAKAFRGEQPGWAQRKIGTRITGFRQGQESL